MQFERTTRSDTYFWNCRPPFASLSLTKLTHFCVKKSIIHLQDIINWVILMFLTEYSVICDHCRLSHMKIVAYDLKLVCRGELAHYNLVSGRSAKQWNFGAFGDTLRKFVSCLNFYQMSSCNCICLNALLIQRKNRKNYHNV